MQNIGKYLSCFFEPLAHVKKVNYEFSVRISNLGI